MIMKLNYFMVSINSKLKITIKFKDKDRNNKIYRKILIKMKKLMI